MASRKITKIVDGYSVMKAAQKAVKGPSAPAARPAPAGAPPRPEASGGTAPYKRAGRTALPTRHEVMCYQCGFSFQISGMLKTSACAKCRTDLDLTSHTVEGETDQTLQTAGPVQIAGGAVFRGPELFARDVVVAGKLAAGKARIYGTLELRPDARFEEATTQARHLRIAAGADIRLEQPAEYDNVEIIGTLRANLNAKGLVTVRAGGCFDGRLDAARLAVEDGGGLLGSIEIGVDRK